MENDLPLNKCFAAVCVNIAPIVNDKSSDKYNDQF